MRYSAKPLRSSGRIVKTVADTTDPKRDPSPPKTTMTSIYADFMNPKEEGSRILR